MKEREKGRLRKAQAHLHYAMSVMEDTKDGEEFLDRCIEVALIKLRKTSRMIGRIIKNKL